MADKIKIEILEDGTIKTSTDSVSQANHTNAEGFLRDMGRLAGGKTEIKARAAHLHGALAAHIHAEGEHTHEH